MVALVKSMTGDHPASAAVVISNNPQAAGLKRAADLGVPTEVVDHRPFGKDRAAFEAVLNKTLKPYQVDLICQAGFMRILTEGFVLGWQGKMLNIHPSLLPKYKGLNAHIRALEAGDHEAGCSVHLVTPELYGGPVLGQVRVPIEPGDTEQALAARVLVQEHLLYPKVLRQFVQGNNAPLNFH